jgi:hypothetical protein
VGSPASILHSIQGTMRCVDRKMARDIERRIRVDMWVIHLLVVAVGNDGGSGRDRRITP